MIDTKKYEGHTPGPWAVVGAPDHIHAHRIFHNNTYIGSVSNSDMSLEDMEPDARLIADAPMLLASLITAEARIKELEEALIELMSIVKIHSRNTEDNFAWAEMIEAQKAIDARAALKGKD